MSKPEFPHLQNECDCGRTWGQMPWLGIKGPAGQVAACDPCSGHTELPMVVGVLALAGAKPSAARDRHEGPLPLYLGFFPSQSPTPHPEVSVFFS